MLTTAIGKVVQPLCSHETVSEWEVLVDGEARKAIVYPGFVAPLQAGDEVLLNTTAQHLHLGTGGYDFIIANLTRPSLPPSDAPGHVIKGRYTPFQHAVLTLEEQAQYADVWNRDLEGLPVLVGQLHSQVAPAVAGLFLAGKQKIAYIMTDQAALPLGLSHLVRTLKEKALLHVTITCGQAFGGDWETVTLHSALLAARHIGLCDAAIVCQGPGSAGTGTRYGFSGIEQAQNLDIVRALEGTAIAIARMSEGDARARHQGISHHTRTALDLTYSRCLVPLPSGADDSALPPGHDVRFVPGTDAALSWLEEHVPSARTMGRTPSEDRLFFQSAAAAGLVLKEKEEESE